MKKRTVCALVFGLLLAAGPRGHAAIFTVTNGTDVGFGTLREAIQQANSLGGKDTILFQIPPTGVFATIQPTNQLPFITDPVTINGWSQLGGATCQAGIEIDGSLAGLVNGLTISIETNCSLTGICINRFGGNGILINQGGDHRIFGCFIGTDVAGTTDLGNAGDGIVMVSSSNNAIGLVPTYSCTNRNIISGNGRHGVEMLDSAGACYGNIFQNNHIGVDFNGSAAIANDEDGIHVDGARVTGNDIGSTAAPKPVNVISGNGINGVYLYQGGANDVLGNHIGVNRMGDAAVANWLNGVWITNASGCVVGDNGGEARNVISGNGEDGVEVGGLGTSGNFIMGNYIGIGTNGLGPIPNGGHGVLLTSECTQNKVGDETTALGRNVISGNDECGVKIGERAFGNWVYRNYIGVSRDGLLAVTNRQHGVLVDSAAYGIYVGNAAITNSGNVISGNGHTNTYHGVCIQGGAGSIEVARNLIGLNANNFPAPNAGDGIRVQNAGTNTIGGSDPDDRNFISGNRGCGIQLGASAARNTVLGNFIGLDTNGVLAIPNGKEGVLVYRSQHNQIGQSGGGRNIISGNAGSGVMISDNASSHDNTVEDNFIGTGVSGVSKVGNSDHGVYIQGGVSNLVGGYVAGTGNTISGNDLDGVRIQDAGALYNLVYRNFIGVDASGVVRLGNGQYGVSIFSAGCTTIGDPGGRGNTIGGNGDDGVHIQSPSATGNVLRANWIGGNFALTLNLSNRLNGVWIGNNASGNTVGSTNTSVESNVIAFNGGAGVRVLSGTNNAVLWNMMWSNALLGVDIGPLGVSPNDAQDVDTGGNMVQNFPVLYEATTNGTDTVISGYLNSMPLTTYWVSFFRCLVEPDPTGYGEADSQILITNLTTDAGGNAFFEVVSPVYCVAGTWITAIAVDPWGNSSEFAGNVAVIPDYLYGDADGDGMPTSWEGPNHLDPNDGTGTNGAAGDPDGDTTDNYDEYVADTDPSNPDSQFEFTAMNRPGSVIVTYSSTNTRYYVAQYATNIAEGSSSWTNLYATSVAGSNGVTSAADTGSATTRLYRAQVQLVP